MLMPNVESIPWEKQLACWSCHGPIDGPFYRLFVKQQRKYVRACSNCVETSTARPGPDQDKFPKWLNQCWNCKGPLEGLVYWARVKTRVKDKATGIYHDKFYDSRLCSACVRPAINIDGHNMPTANTAPAPPPGPMAGPPGIWAPAPEPAQGPAIEPEPISA